ncbi:hypothetical protein KFK09_001653 [Dendrobium nobile]|uniref:Uncharacterized protein n=1 Tax=Dendrobium nobile TaxID=94219 RepID=A0A8T3C5E4_DENNO|nr:hypothetical protein KFK09_001653 [Dendrobium nobile]
MEGARLLLVRTEQSRREGGGSASCLAKTESERLKELGPAVILEKKKDPSVYLPRARLMRAAYHLSRSQRFFFL